MTVNDIGDLFVVHRYLVGGLFHTQTLSLGNDYTAGSPPTVGNDPDTLTKSGSILPFSIIWNAYINAIADTFTTEDTLSISADVFFKATPTSDPLWVFTDTGTGASQGTASPTFFKPANQTVTTFRSSVGGIMRFTLMENIAFIAQGMSPTNTGNTVLNGINSYLLSSSCAFVARDGGKLVSGMRTISKTNDKLRKIRYNIGQDGLYIKVCAYQPMFTACDNGTLSVVASGEGSNLFDMYGRFDHTQKRITTNMQSVLSTNIVYILRKTDEKVMNYEGWILRNYPTQKNSFRHTHNQFRSVELTNRIGAYQTMASAKKTSTYSNDNFKGFAQVKLDAESGRAFGNWVESLESHQIDEIQAFIVEGWKTSITWNDNNQAFIASSTCQDDRNVNHGICVTSYSDSVLEAFLMNVYKVNVMFHKQKLPTEGTGSRWG